MLLGQSIFIAGSLYTLGIVALMIYAFYKEFRGELETPTGRLD